MPAGNPNGLPKLNAHRRRRSRAWQEKQAPKLMNRQLPAGQTHGGGSPPASSETWSEVK